MLTPETLKTIKKSVAQEAQDLGFQQVGISSTELGEHVERYQEWLAKGLHADLDYMASHGSKRWQPDHLIHGTLRVISVRMNYFDLNIDTQDVLDNPNKAYVSRYALGRDYHKTIRQRLKKLIQHIERLAGEHDFRAFVDSAPVLERAFAQRSGLGWFGKNTMLINRDAGSWFFLGEIYTNLPLPTDEAYEQEHCGRCTACLDDCPTKAFVEPYVLDTKRCISYLTIESKEAIPEEFRPLMGNRIFGCDDCQLVCPWTRFGQQTEESDFTPRHHLEDSDLLELFSWDEKTFLEKTAGSPIRRAGYEGWQRNIAVALGNADYSDELLNTLKSKLGSSSPLVAEHLQWAIEKQIANSKNESNI